jgi:polygalacturonase
LFAKHTDNGLRIKSATTRGGTIEDVYFINSTLDSIRTAYQFNLNWYPAYSYSELPKGYNIDSVPQHWSALLQRVTPAEKGIPFTKNFYISNVKITNAQKAFEVNGLPQSQIENFNFTNSSVSAAVLGEMIFAKNWTYKNFEISITQKAEEKKKAGGIEEQERLKQ